MGAALSVLKYLSNSFHSVKVSPLLLFLQTCCLLIFFYCLLLYLPLISTFQNLLILHAPFPTLPLLPPLKLFFFFFPDHPDNTVPLTRFFSFFFSAFYSSPPLNASFIMLWSLREHSRASCMAAYVRKANFSHGAAGENWDSLCPPRDAICPCRRAR